MKNSKAIQFLLQLVFMAMPIFLLGQGVINWGPETTHEDKSIFSILGHSSESVFVGALRQNNYNTILEFGKDRQLKKKLILNEIIDKNLEHALDFSFKNDRISILIMRRNEVKSKKPITYVERLTVEDGQVTDRETIHTINGIDYLYFKTAKMAGFRSKNYDSFSMHKFRNDTKLLLALNKGTKETHEKSYLLFDRENDLGLISKSNYSFANSKAVDRLQDISIDSKNNILLFIKNYISYKLDAEGNTKEKRKGAPNYKFTVAKISPTKNSILEIDPESKYWVSSEMSVNSNDEIFISTTYTDKFKLATGVFNANTNAKADGMMLYKISPENKIAFTKNHRIDQLDREGGFYHTDAITNDDNGNIYIISNEDYVGMICEKFDSKGAYLGADQLTRKIFVLRGSAFATIQIIGRKNNIDLIYNASSDFIKRLENEKSKDYKLPSKDNRIVRTAINLADMKFDHQEISTIGNMHITHESFSIIDGKTYVLGSDGSYSKLRLGSIE